MMNNNQGMGIIPLMLLLTTLSIIMIMAIKKAGLINEITRDAQHGFQQQEALNALARASVSLCIEMITQHAPQAQGLLKGVCKEWPYKDGTTLNALIDLQSKAGHYEVFVQMKGPDWRLPQGISYTLVRNSGHWEVEDWGFKDIPD